jgi:hypothetical protein
VTTKTENPTTAAKRSEPQPSAGKAPASGHPEQPAQHTERKEAQQDRHSRDATQMTVSATVPSEPGLGTEWYAGLSPKVKRYIEQKNPQNTRDLYAMLLEVVEHLETRVGVTS